MHGSAFYIRRTTLSLFLALGLLPAALSDVSAQPSGYVSSVPVEIATNPSVSATSNVIEAASSGASMETSRSIVSSKPAEL